jgi:TolB protein
MALALAACSGNGGRPQAVSQQEPSLPQPEEPSSPTEEAIQGDELPGKLLFVQDGTIWMWSGGQAQRLIGEGVAWQPDWSPDGKRIVYVERGESYTDVMLADARGNHLDQLTFNGSRYQLQSHERIYDTMWSFYPTWSPDGTHIAMASQYGPPFGSPAVEYNLSLFMLSLDSGNRLQLYADSNAQCGHIAYMPTGPSTTSEPRFVAFTHASMRPEGYQQIYRFDLNSETSEPFPGVPPHSYDPAFYPDGRWLAFAARNTENSTTDIWVLPTTTTSDSAAAPQRLTSLGKARAPVFSPDGTMLAFLAIPPRQAGFDLWVADLSIDSTTGMIKASEPRQVTFEMSLDADSGLSWAP